MNEHSLELLEFYRIREEVLGYCLSYEGSESLLSSLPLREPEEVRLAKEETEELYRLLKDSHKLPSGSFPPIHDAIKNVAKEGSTLAVEELWAIGTWSQAYSNFLHWLSTTEHEAIKKSVAAAPELMEVQKTAFHIIGPDGELKDIPELRAIKDRIRKINQEIERLSASFFMDEATRGLLQSDVPTQRDGRTVLAVKAGAKSRFKGIIHELSATGQTVYIEPEILLSKNNELVEEEARYQRELFRLLKEASGKIRKWLPLLHDARELVARLDAIYAKARYSIKTEGVFALVSSGGIELLKARHPILGSKAIPIDLFMPDGARTLIITGPNTGGKTVSLKTAGLLAMMNQYGLAIPAAFGSALPIFDGVWADIGDEQSMDQSLSTFSGHMKNIAEIVKQASGNSLVLLDELGSGTDPEEGCAIAMALLDLFISKGSLCLVSTHHGILKNFGYTKEGVLNASVDFDKDTLSPTYRIVMGIPGESRALDIASRNGLSPELIEGARQYLKDERSDISALIKSLSDKHRELDSIRSEEKKRLKEAREEQRKADLRELKLRQKEAELRSQGVSELKNLLSESRKTLENLVREIREEELTKEKTQEVKDFLLKLDTEVKEAEFKADMFVKHSKPVLPGSGRIEAGSAVLLLPGRRRGLVLRPAKGGKWLVETDALRLTVDEADMELTEALPNKAPMVSVENAASRSSKAVLELDLRGYRLADALVALERQLDAAILAGLYSFSVIHGTGEGVLQAGVKSCLSSYAAVKSFHYARPEEGGHGKTIIELGN
ncbi:endonuclease MutS2 [Spirochaetota bacterium]